MNDNDNNFCSSSEESLSDDDEDGWRLTGEVEKEFYKTLSQIKNKDPKIYKKDVEFFKDISIPEEKKSAKPKSNPLTLRDYERKIVLEKGGEFSDEESVQQETKKPREPTYVEEQESLKKSFKAVLNSDSEVEGDEWGGLFKKREKPKGIEEEDDEDYKKWLKGQKNDVPDKEVKEQMKPLHDFWTNPNLNQEEQFLRDYVLNKKYIENDEDNNTEHVAEIDDGSDGNEETYNHRFEEPDQEFIKRYPRVMENSIRRKKDHRKQKRDEVKERKHKEKEKKMAEIKLKKKLKKKEIEDKIEELKKLTGNDQLAFENVLERDFDLDEHDKAMQRLFSDEFYLQDDPNFNPSGSTVAEDAWNEDWSNEREVEFEDDEEINCEDPNFNMDCDYDPAQEKPKEKGSRSRRRKDKHRRTTLSEVVNKEKPVFDPATHQSFQQYVDQYYAIDCEDFIGDLPCRFKYRRTIPNAYGLTVEEILAADEKELERWCSIKRVHQLRPEHKEKCDVKVYKKKATDEELKRKILPSLFKKSQEHKVNSEEQRDVLDEQEARPAEPKSKHSHKIKSSKNGGKREVSDYVQDEKRDVIDDNEGFSLTDKESTETKALDKSASLQKKKKKKKKKKKMVKDGGLLQNNKNITTDITVNRKRKNEGNNVVMSKKKKKNWNDDGNQSSRQTTFKSKNSSKSERLGGRPIEENNLTKMSDARLLAYGIKPKKFRNKLKYDKNIT